MSLINNILLGVHILCVIAILSLLLHQWNKSPRRLNPGILHAGATALIAGVAMVGMHSNVNPDEDLNPTKYGIKLVVLLTILVIGYKNVKKPELKTQVWLVLIGLTITNILIASFWK